MILSEKIISLSNGVDLTNPSVRTHLGIDLTELVVSQNTPGAYLKPQIIGAVAEKLGVDFIIVPSTMNPKLKNLIILK